MGTRGKRMVKNENQQNRYNELLLLIRTEIKRRRKSLGLSQRELAEKIGYTRVRWSQIEKNGSSQLNILLLICEVFGCTLMEFLNSACVFGNSNTSINSTTETMGENIRQALITVLIQQGVISADVSVSVVLRPQKGYKFNFS